MNDNKLIAEFMGAEKTHIQSVGDIYCPVPSKSGSEYADKLQYHNSWDWLMPVIEECKATNVHPKMPTIMQSTLTLILDDIDDLMTGHWGIELTYKQVVNFITKYNEYKHIRHDVQ